MDHAYTKPDGRSYWNCLCNCGTTRAVCVQYLIAGRSKSCGCLALEANTKHGAWTSPEWKCWSSMKRRCQNPNDDSYSRYGGRGIIICERWQDFTNFVADMGKRPTLGHSIDRINNDGPYSPENCRWATAQEQQNNRRVNVVLEMGGKRLTITQWAVEIGIPYGAIRYRLDAGWETAEALTRPLGTPVFGRKPYGKRKPKPC